MEHRLVTGGYEFLPFARSCVVKLKKLGLPYADQSFEIGGVSIKVRIEPGHEYIRIDGGSLPIAMDSGVVDLINVGAFVEARFYPGILYPSTQVADYKVNFTKPVNGGKTNPSGGIAGQFLGYLEVSSARVRGTVFDKAYSFYPKNKLLSAPGDPAIWGADPEDAAVWAKKYMVNKCPVSMFTGKCRLYAQAIYGKPLYKRNALNPDGSETGETVGDPDIPIAQDGGSGPYLTLFGYAKPGEQSPGTIDIWTSSGVYLHPATGCHFLMNPSGTLLRVYPLVSSEAGEVLRTLIRTSGGLNDADKERCEAYILAYSRPDMSKVQTISGVFPTGFNFWSLGYGLHWNWSGTKATITTFEVETFGVSMDTTILNKSSRYELNVNIPVSLDKSFTASASLTTVESNVYWYVLRGYACIAEPEWSYGGMEKSTNKFNRENYPCDAPFYSFYKRDELQVARVKVTKGALGDPYREVSDSLFGSTDLTTVVGGVTVGDLGGWSRETHPMSTLWSVSFSCGSTTVSWDIKTQTIGYQEISAKAFGDDNTTPSWPGWQVLPIPGSPGGDGFYPPYYAPVGYPNQYSVWATTPLTGEVFTGIYRSVTYSRSSVTNSYNSLGYISAVAPRYDAEAMFLYQRQEVSENFDTPTVTNYGGYGFNSIVRAGGDIIQYTVGSPATLSSPVLSVIPPVLNTVVTITETASLVCSSGTVPANKDLLKLGLEDYGEDVYPGSVTVFSSASTNVVVSGYINTPVGTDRTGELLGMVGWV